MYTYLERLDRRLQLPTLLLLFWSVFWLLNGLDKFYNEPTFFGVTRDAAFVEYFARLDLSPTLALISLYTCGITEVLLGLGFGAALVRRTPVLARLCLKGSLLLFAAFCAADILFGDRKELWEHATFLILVLASILALRNGRGQPRPDLPLRLVAGSRPRARRNRLHPASE